MKRKKKGRGIRQLYGHRCKWSKTGAPNLMIKLYCITTAVYLKEKLPSDAEEKVKVRFLCLY